MRILATFCFSFAAGIFAACYLLPPRWLLPLAAACWLLGLLGALALRGIPRKRAALIALGLALSLGWACGFERFIYQPFEDLAGTEETLTLELCGFAEATETGARAEARIPGRGPHGRVLHGRVMLYGGAELLEREPGERLEGRFSMRSAAVVRGETVRSFTARGVFLLLYAEGEAAVSAGRAGTPRYLPQRLARRMRASIDACFPEDTRAFLYALLLGDRSALSVEETTALSEAGLSHIIAVSGLHCAFLYAIFHALIGWPRLTVLFSVPALILYALLTGASASVVRACAMLIIAMFAPLFGRENDAPTSLSLVLVMILIRNPYAAQSVSLQLSFGSMLGILSLSPRLYAEWMGESHTRFRAVLTGSMSTTAGALLSTVPLTALYFDTLPLAAPLSNLLCLAPLSFVFASGFVSMALGCVWPAGGRALAVLPAAGTRLLFAAVRFFASLPWHALHFSEGCLRYWLIYAYALLFLCASARRVRRHMFRMASLALAALTLALTLCAGSLPYDGGALHLTVLDVGQGQCVLLRAGGQTALIDCGSGNSFISAGERAADYLQSVGCETIDYVILTHYHSDHVNGLPVLFERLRVGTLLLPDVEPEDALRQSVLDLAARHDIPAEMIPGTAAARVYALGEAALTVCPPLGTGGMNEEGLSVLCTAGRFDVLITGDMNMETEALLIAAVSLPDIEVLIAGHHGSRTSTGGALLDASTPEVGIVSSGSNRYGHPNRSTLRRLEEASVAVYRTDQQGNIHVIAGGN